MDKNIINVKMSQFFPSGRISYREEINDFVKNNSNLFNSKSLILDFDGIMFIGMSPADELLKEISRSNSKVKFSNMVDFVGKVIQGQIKARNKSLKIQNIDSEELLV